MFLHSFLSCDNFHGMPASSATDQMVAVCDEQVLVERWRGLLVSYNEVSGALDRELHEQHGIGLSEYEALERLVDHGDKCLMKVLGSDMYLSQSALSRAVDRLERCGLVTRGACDADRRSIFVRATDAGYAKYADAKATHRRVLADHLT